MDYRLSPMMRMPNMTAKRISTAFDLRVFLISQLEMEMAVYKLAPAKGGSKLRELGPNPGDNVIVNRQAGHLSAEQMPMSQLVDILRGEPKRPVLDATGIKGVFDVKLDWAPDAVAGGGPCRKSF
jgi:uncharacterized protein (TIGR03435 family)